MKDSEDRRTMRALWMSAVAVAVWCLQVSGQDVTGTLVDGATGDPIEGAWVALLHDERPVETVLTDAKGAFSLRLPSEGPYSLRADRMGYETVVTPPLFGEQSVGLEIRLHPRAVELRAIEVTAARPVERRGFEARVERDRGGHYITRDDIDELDAQHTSDLLRGVPGVRLEADPIGSGQRVTFGQGCDPAIVLDGAHGRTGASVDELIDPSKLRGIEVYRSWATVPAELGMSSQCGLIALWSLR
jgi:hypothetical protein